jgi:signal transduction histidine kinase
MLVPAIAVALIWVAPGARDAPFDSSVGVVLAMVGAASIAAHPRSRTGDVIGWAGMAWFAGNFALSGFPALAALGRRTVFLHRAVIGHAAATLPFGRPRRWTWLPLAGLYALALAPAVQRGHPGAVLWAALLVGTAIGDIVQRPNSTRVDRGATLAVSGLLAATVAVELRGDAYRVAIIVVGLAAAVATVEVGRRRARLSESVIELVHGPDPAVRAAFVAALGDPRVEVAFADRDGWVDEFGMPVSAPADGPGRRVSRVELDGRPVAAVTHAAELADDPALARALAQAATLAAQHVRLRADVRHATDDAAASRSRVAAEARRARSDFATAVREGPGELLVAADRELAAAGAAASPAAVALGTIRGQIDELLAGLGPLAAASGLLVPSLRTLAERSPLEVELDIEPGADVTGTAAETLWFVCAEALTNVAKHTASEHAEVRLSVRAGLAIVEVVDTGTGGADPSAGSGLQGLTDRLAAVGGELRVESTPAGTRLVAAVPIAPAEATVTAS